MISGINTWILVTNESVIRHKDIDYLDDENTVKYTNCRKKCGAVRAPVEIWASGAVIKL